jgi:septal ring factor EnvC (AmiA/AmiB activator)
MVLSKTSLYRLAILSAAFLGMGAGMPSCPGQQAMQQQIDTLQGTTNEQTKKLQVLESQVKALAGENGQMKMLLEQVVNRVQAQQQSLEQTNTAVQAIQAKLTQLTAAPTKAAKPAAKKKAH